MLGSTRDPERYSTDAKIYTPQKWNELIEKVLLYVIKNPSSIKDHWFIHDKRPILPDGFGRNSQNIFIFLYKGTFLPSSNLDGKFWKPSQGTKTTGMYCKRFFYHTDSDGLKLKRQVTWIRHSPEWQIVEYRACFRSEKVCSWEIDYPEDGDWNSLVEEVLEKSELTKEEWDSSVKESDEHDMKVGMGPVILSEDPFDGYFPPT